MFADRAKIYIRSGKGGDGHVSFRRELYVPNGGPDGGDGGRGGDVIFEVDKGLNTLVDFRHKTKYKAQDGEEGGKKRCHGKDAKDLILKVPEGTKKASRVMLCLDMMRQQDMKKEICSSVQLSGEVQTVSEEHPAIPAGEAL